MEKTKAKDADKEIEETPQDSRLVLQLESSQRPSPTQLRDLFLTSIIPGLDNNVLLLHRKDDTMKLHRRFSASPGEPELQVLDIISAAHKAARKVSVHIVFPIRHLFASFGFRINWVSVLSMYFVPCTLRGAYCQLINQRLRHTLASPNTFSRNLE